MRSIVHAALHVLLSGACLMLVGCSNSPNEQEATAAVRATIAGGGKLAGVQLPSSVGIKRVTVGECVDSTPLEGKYCAVNIVSEEIPVLGAVAVPARLRFAKRDGAWQVFLN